ncbi:TatD family deoxyribonuclease [bacterium]|nr:TatD family deoxyribonuclease [bacterium]
MQWQMLQYYINNQFKRGNKMKLFDNHSHLNDEKFDEDRDEIIQEIINTDTKNFITAGYSLEGSKKAVEISNKYDFMYATCGISPNDIPQNEEELWKMLDEIRNLIKNNNKKVVAVGEIGLDYYWNTDNRELQKKAFIEQIKLANELDLPIVIHTRDAIMDTLEILKENPVKNKGVFHCCPQNRELIKEGLKLGFYISFAGPITFKSSKNADEMINLVPNDRILIETDSPYLAPEPVRGTRNTPINVKYVAQKIADAKGMALEEIADITYENARKIFKI